MPQKVERIIKMAEDILSERQGGLVSLSREDLEEMVQELLRYCNDIEGRNDELQRRLEEAEQTIDAIRYGEVDAIVRSDNDGTRVYTLEGPDFPYRSIVETMNAGAVTIDRLGTIFYSNAAFACIMGIPLEGLIGSSFHDLVVPEDLPLFLEFLKKTEEEEKITEQLRLKGQNGTVFVGLAGSRQAAHNMERISIVVTDISPLKSAEQSSRKAAELAERQRDRLAALIDSMNDAVWFMNAQGQVMLVNAVGKAQALEVGIDPDAISHTLAPDILSQVDVLAPEGTPLQLERLARVFRGEPLRPLEVAIRNRRTQAFFYRRISANPILDREKRLEGVIAVVQDITAEKQAAEEKRRLEEQLRQSQKLEAIGTLAGGIAHDFNNMLAVVMGNAELALDDLDADAGPKRNIEQIVKASRRARDLVKQILAFSRRTERGRKPLRLAPLIKETNVLLRGSLPSTIAINLELKADHDTVMAEPSQIQQVLMNLATNAAHAMRKGGTLTVSLSSVTFGEGVPLPDPELAPGTYVKLTVRDTGRGMTDDVKRRIFEPFFTTKPSGQGTGMGLAVVYGIVKGHAGAITVESAPGKGSTFTVYLPHAHEQPEEETKERGRAPHGKGHILLVDDEPLVVEMTSLMLKGLGYDVTTAQNGAEALDMFRGRPDAFDLVMTDQTMPEMTGITLAEKILKERKGIPIVLFTGYSEAVSPEKAKAAGIREFVMKPVAKREIAQTIRRALDDVRRGAPK